MLFKPTYPYWFALLDLKIMERHVKILMMDFVSSYSYLNVYFMSFEAVTR